MTTTILSTLVSTTTTVVPSIYVTPATYDITPYASYVAIACVLFFILFIIVARLVITVDTQQSDLVLFNKSPQKHLLLLVSKQLYNSNAATNNIASAIANGLMEPPPNYDMSKINAATNNKILNSNSNNNNNAIHAVGNDFSTKTSTTTLNSTVTNDNTNGAIPRTNHKVFETIDTIEPAKAPSAQSNKRSKW